MKKRIAAIAFSAALAFSTNVSALSAFADDGVKALALDNTDVLNDLSDINFDELAQASLTEIRVLRFMEYGFTTANDDAYGLYVYLYNPLGLELSGRAGAHVANVATEYDEKGEPVAYENVTLKLLDTSARAGTGTFHKLRIVGDVVDELYDHARTSQLNEQERRYDVAGVQLWQKGFASGDLDASLSTVGADLGAIKTGVKDYDVGMTYTFTGFAQGYGPGASKASTLKCSYTELATIELDLQHTNYRAGAGATSLYQDEINSVYFSIPEEVFAAYGDLTAISAEWYEYKTQPILITTDPNAYGALDDFIGKDLSEFDNPPDWRILWDLQMISNVDGIPIIPYFKAGKTYNVAKDITLKDFYNYSEIRTKGAEMVSRFDWLFDAAKDHPDLKISRAEIENYAGWYTKKFGGETVAGAGQEYSAALFASEIDADRQQYLTNPEDKRGHMQMTIRADDKKNLIEDRWSSMSFWNKLGVLFGWVENAGYTEKYDPIVTYTEEEYRAAKEDPSDADFCKKLLISEEDYKGGDGKNNATSFAEYADAAFKKNHRLVLFRFAQTQYYSSAAVFDYMGNKELSDIDGYVSQKTCFLNFDVISLTFEKEGVQTILACVADPIDIFNGTTPPEGFDAVGCGRLDLKKVFAVLLIIGVVVLGIFLWEKTRDVRMSWKVSSIDRELKRSNRSKRRRRKRK